MSHCSQCGVAFSCGMVDAKSTEQCWCSALPTATTVLRDPDGEAKTCLCQDCLSALRIEQIKTPRPG